MAKDNLENINADAEFVKPGQKLESIDKDAHDATYDESGDLLIKSVKPVAAVLGGEKGTAETGVSAKIHEPLAASDPIQPIDTVPEEARRGALAPDHTVETVEVVEGKEDGIRGLKTGDKHPQAENKEEIVEEVLEATGADKTEAAKDSEESVKAAEKREDSEVAGEPAKKASEPKNTTTKK